MTQPKMSMKEAMALVLADLKAMTPEQLRAELDANKGGDIACALRELHEFAASPEFAEAMASAPPAKLTKVVLIKGVEDSPIMPNALELHYDDGSFRTFTGDYNRLRRDGWETAKREGLSRMVLVDTQHTQEVEVPELTDRASA